MGTPPDENDLVQEQIEPGDEALEAAPSDVDEPPADEPETHDDEGEPDPDDEATSVGPDASAPDELDDEDAAEADDETNQDIDDIPGLSVEWKGHTLKVVGDWTFRWLWLAPTYELWLDDQLIDRIAGPRVRPLLEAVYEDSDGELLHIEADILSLVGLRPKADILVEGEIIKQGRVPVMNTINPFLILVIIVATAIMIYVGPDVLRSVYYTQIKG